MNSIDYNNPDNCVFCKIVKGNIPAQTILENDIFLAFLDIHPASPGHTLLIPKTHIRWVYDIEPVEQFWNTARDIVYTLKSSLEPEWVQYFTHGGVTHAHLHIIPRYDNIDEAPALLPQKPSNTTELENMASRIRSAKM